MMCIGCCATVAALAAEGFLTRVEDLPLAPGLAEDVRNGFAFDSASGRIVDAYATGDISEEQVLRFYRETLPQLGWTAEGDGRYRRNGEQLRLDVDRDADGVTVHYSLSPQ